MKSNPTSLFFYYLSYHRESACLVLLRLYSFKFILDHGIVSFSGFQFDLELIIFSCDPVLFS